MAPVSGRIPLSQSLCSRRARATPTAPSLPLQCGTGTVARAPGSYLALGHICSSPTAAGGVSHWGDLGAGGDVTS